jgi:uncharacterized phage protein gp47/JayE
MAFDRPSLQQLIDRAAADIEAELPGVDARLRRSNLGVLARVHAAAAHGLHGHLAWLADQLMIDTCEAPYLDRYGAVWGVYRTPAQYAEGPIGLSGVDGSVVPAGTALLGSNGLGYSTVADATIIAGVATADVVADLAGAAGNALQGAPLQLVVPVPGVQSAAAVGTGGLVYGADEETDDALRGRLLLRVRTPPRGGAASDYVSWALSVAGVTRAWCYPLENGPGTVVVRFMRDGDTQPIPGPSAVAQVQELIDRLRPVTASVLVAAPVAAPLNFSIAVSPDTVAVRGAVQTALADLLLREAEPGAPLWLSRIREAVSGAVGEADNLVSAPAADVIPAAGSILTMGTITWV